MTDWYRKRNLGLDSPELAIGSYFSGKGVLAGLASCISKHLRFYPGTLPDQQLKNLMIGFP